MNNDAVLSFREHLQSGVASFAATFTESGLTADVLAEFVVVLANYQEEGTHLFPAVFITEDIQQVLTLTHGSDAIVIGKGNQSRETVRKAFKLCAPLVEGRAWAVFVELRAGELRYGIFRNDLSPLVVTPFERLRQCFAPELKVIGLSRLGASFVEVRSATGNYQYISMSGNYEEANNPPKMIRDFMRIVTRDAPPELKMQLQSFYYRVGIDVLHGNHGTLLAVIPHGESATDLFQDGVILENRIHVLDEISRHLANDTEDSTQRLYVWSKLILRMSAMDGITVLDTRGSVVGYNCFISSATIAPESQLKLSTLGGARRRAFNALCANLGTHLVGALYKSQDGVIDLGSQ